MRLKHSNHYTGNLYSSTNDNNVNHTLKLKHYFSK
jgi:hypothetical protein